MDRQSAARVALIPAQRQARILEILQADGAAAVLQLADAIGASVATVRRDLEALEAKGFLDRTFGGASLRARALVQLEPGHALSAHIHRDEKVAIGIAAAARIEPNQSVIFDSSSTVGEAARALLRRDIPITAITNDLSIAQMLASSTAITVLTIGGRVRGGSMTVFGPPGEEFLARLRADVALMGAHAVTLDGPSEVAIEIARIKQMIAGAARRLHVLADHTKFGDASTFRICGIEDVDELITDRKVDPVICAALRERGVAVTLVSGDAG